MFLAALIVPSLRARVVRVEVTSRTDVLNGKQFGTAGTYERITGRIYFSLPVTNPHNLRIVDLSDIDANVATARIHERQRLPAAPHAIGFGK